MRAERILQFVDSNVLIYAYDVTAGAKHERAKALVARLWETRDGCLSIQVLQEFCVTVTRKVARPLAADVAADVVADLAAWRVHAPMVEDMKQAIAIHRRYAISFWDAMIVRSAAQLGCATLWSEDLNAGQVYEGVRIINPFAEPEKG
jgi:predicted nucleic acid-binding protein